MLASCLVQDHRKGLDIGQVKGVKGKGKTGIGKKGKRKRKNKDRKESGEAKGSAPTDDSDFAGDCG